MWGGGGGQSVQTLDYILGQNDNMKTNALRCLPQAISLPSGVGSASVRIIAQNILLVITDMYTYTQIQESDQAII